MPGQFFKCSTTGKTLKHLILPNATPRNRPPKEVRYVKEKCIKRTGSVLFCFRLSLIHYNIVRVSPSEHFLTRRLFASLQQRYHQEVTFVYNNLTTFGTFGTNLIFVNCNTYKNTVQYLYFQYLIGLCVIF